MTVTSKEKHLANTDIEISSMLLLHLNMCRAFYTIFYYIFTTKVNNHLLESKKRMFTLKTDNI